MFKKSGSNLFVKCQKLVRHQKMQPITTSLIYNNDSQIEEGPIYENHILLSNFQRGFLAVGSGLTSIFNPARGDMIGVFAETTGNKILSKMYSQMLQSTEGSQILESKPRINSSTVDLSYLATLPKDTLGHYYMKFLEVNKVTPDSRLPVQFIDNIELAYVMQRYREIHDIVHTILCMPTNMLGEVAVKWVESFQTELPMCTLAAIFGAGRLRPKQRLNYATKILPWVLKVGNNAKPFMNIYFENRWEQNMTDLWKEMNIDPPPKL